MKRNVGNILTSLFLFFLAGLCEIGGGYLVWLWLREDMSWVLGVIGGFVLFAYGIIPTFQPSHFHRIYAAYGGIFIIMAMGWGWLFERTVPGGFDVLGIMLAIIGVIVYFICLERGTARNQSGQDNNSANSSYSDVVLHCGNCRNRRRISCMVVDTEKERLDHGIKA